MRRQRQLVSVPGDAGCEQYREKQAFADVFSIARECAERFTLLVTDRNENLEKLRACFEGWDVELIQLGRGRSTACGCVATLTSLRVARVRAGRAVSVRGRGPALRGCLLLSSAQGAPIRLLGREIQSNQFAFLDRRAHVELFLPSDATLCIIEMETFARISTAQTQVRMAPLEYIATLLHRAETVCGGRVSGRGLEAAFDEEIRTAIEASTIVQPRVGTRGLRATAVARACRFVNSHLGKPISLADLCRHCSVGTRTLEYGFRQFYDTTPIRFIKNQRLSRMRGALLRSNGQPVAIGQVAKRLGFTHMGQFAQDYRLLFGESPSATLQRTRKSASDRLGQPELGASTHST